jgi:tetratricopeptide (TPR) repeat protein
LGKSEMSSAKARRVLRIAVANLAIVFVLLTVTELVCRQLERVKAGRELPIELQTLPPKGRAELRVFAFGGSTVYGGSLQNVGFVAQIQYWLSRLYPDRNIRVYNLGWPGVNTTYVLRELTRRLDDQPDLIIAITGHNEFLWSGPEEGLGRIRQMLFSHFAAMRLLQQSVRRIMKSRKDYALPCQVAAWDRESTAYHSRVATFEESMNLIVRRASQRGVKLIVGTLPSNISDWPPVYKRLAGRDQRYLDTVSRIQELIRVRKYQEASDAVTAAFSAYPEDAMLYFLRGQIQSAMGNFADARDSFVKARDLDPFPWRTSSQLNSIIRRAATGVPGVYLLDLERVYEEHSKNGLVGFDLIADNVHGTPLGESISAESLIQEMAKIGFLPLSRKVEEECCPVGAFLAGVGYLEPKSPLRLRFLLNNGTYVMKTPFLNYDLSRKYFLEAREVDENSWVVWANLATSSYLTGDFATGAKELQRATDLHHGPLDVNDSIITPYLKQALDYSAGRASGCPGSP